MALTPRQRTYVTYPTLDAGTMQTMRRSESDSFFRVLHRFIVDSLELSDALADALKVQGYPTAQWRMATGGHRHETAPSMQVAQLAFTPSPNAALEELFLAAQAKQWGAGLDPVATSADYWCPMNGDADFGTRANADARIGAAAIADLRGNDVNVVLVDRGLDMTRLPPGSFGGGWAFTPGPSGGWTFTPGPFTPPGPTVQPGSARGEDAEHGLMMARNILALAPDIRLYDLPIIPPRILNIPMFVASAHAAFLQVQSDIAWLRTLPGRDGPWVIVNSWALFDRRSDLLSGTGSFGADPNHPFRAAVQGLTADGADVVFVAGNCGQYCPDDRCGPRDVGPGYSITGANAYPEVLTVGAVRVDGLPLGYSSQGPGLIASAKPDLCAPSNFTETSDPGLLSTGTSAACAVAAGVVAALRTRTATSTPAATPAAIIAALRAGAGGAICDPQFGFGTINAAATRTILGV